MELESKVKSILDEYLTDEQFKNTIVTRLVDELSELWFKSELVPIPIEKLKEILL